MSTWTAEEDRILVDNFDKSKGQIAKVLRSYGYERTEDGVRRRRQRLRIAGTIPDTYISSTMAADEPTRLGGHSHALPTNPLVDSQTGFSIKRVSTNYDGEGNIRQQWVSEDKNREEILDQMRQAIETLIEPCEGLSLPVNTPVAITNDLMAAYALADVHLGLFSWQDETGKDYDMRICEQILTDSMTELVQSAPATKTCLIVNLADFFHADTMENKTMRSGNVLDVDSRWGKIVQVGTRVYRNLIHLALQKHEKVIVKSAIGNHDDHSSMWLAMLMKAYFENNDRVEIELPISNFSYHVFVKNLIGLTHGGIKADRLPGIMATDRAVDWGKTTYRTFWTGHTHHKEVKEHPGCIVETFRAITAPDAWTHKSGYRSSRTMECVILSRSGGEHGRRIVNIS